ncbi:F-box/WD repeat-containing protein 7 [Sphaceloma murrayae]|uniref:F-box/WD repeat-containing protein 7 n=1 Tax=Sphaceloma murrayae TaxID=2082308 RepID=A0A2K1QGI0_9PEZI|nr:F-box/WD repeat-containing protein 7 [Sphaceloma murrayae]
MPAQVPRAQFEPIPPNLNLTRLVDSYEHFEFCPRITYADIQSHGPERFEKLVKKHVITGGKPLVVEGFQSVLDPWTFSAKWLKDNVGDKVENARDLNSKEFIPLTIRHYLNNISAVTNQHFKRKESAPPRPPQRIYLKDIDCPEVWQQKLEEVIPPFLYYLNESTGDYGGPGSSVLQGPTVPGRRLGKGIASAGDLMSSLPPEMRAENLMCYIGHEGTYTPAHREMCATMGHNIMVEASGDVGEDGKPEKPGSSIWFMTQASDRQTVAEFWLSRLGHDIEVENHYAQINSWKHAPFQVFIVDQRPGDFILIPPLAPHQVWNRGTRTMKVAWNRTTIETLEMAISEALPKARIVCRDEQYKNKAIIYYTLNKYSDLLSRAKAQADKLLPEDGHAMMYKGKIRFLQRDFRRLLVLFKYIMLSEMFSPDGTGEKCEFIPFDSNITCGYCRGNIFNRFLSCNSCKDALGHAEPEPYDVCMECYAMGRSCFCISGHQWTEQFKWKELTGKYEYWRKQITDIMGDTDMTIPLALQEERRRLHKKTLAEVVREQLKKRPYTDPNKPKEDQDNEEPSDEEVIVDDGGRVKKRIKKRSKTWLKNNSRCHVCQYRHENWKMARCTRCDRWWCFGSLFRGHDDMPLDIMENSDWECAHCQGVCFAGNCRRDPRQNPYQPKGTLLGHDTKKIADARSVEVLVDFSVSNLNWIREEENAEESVQMRRAREEAERAREAQAMENDEDAAEVDAPADVIPETLPHNPEDDMIDPELRDESSLAQRLQRFNQTLPPPADMTGRGRTGDYGEIPDGYVPAQTVGYNPLGTNSYDEEDSYLYPDPNELDDPPAADSNGVPAGSDGLRPFLKEGRTLYGQGEYSRGKRSRVSEGDAEIRMEKPKKRRVTEQGAEVLAARPVNEASRQYQGIKERKALEEAKRTGRFFAVNAALRGKKKILRLRVPGYRLQGIVSVPPNNARRVAFAETARVESEDEAFEADLLKSDVQSRSQNKSQTKKPRTRKRRAGESDIEDADEIDASGSEDFDSMVTSTQRTSEGGRRRISAYLQRRHEDEDLPEELPETFKDSRRAIRPLQNGVPAAPRNPNQVRSTNGKWKSTKPPKVKAPYTGKRRGRPSKHALQPAKSPVIDIGSSPSGNGASEDEEEEEEEDDEDQVHQQEQEQHPTVNSGLGTKSRRLQPSITEEEKNRLAKLDALNSIMGGDDAGDDGLEESIGAVAAAAFAQVSAPVASMGRFHG